MTGTGLVVWFTLAITQETAPDELVVPLQLCAELPEPRVRVTVLPADGSHPIAGSSVVSTPERVAEEPLVAAVAPV